MPAVYISKQAVEDLKCIFTALITWEKGPLELDHALQYVNDIEAECYSLVNRNYHFRTTFSTHKIYGSKVLTYRRNRATVWYIIYNIDLLNNIFITKIISNHITT